MKLKAWSLWYILQVWSFRGYMCPTIPYLYPSLTKIYDIASVLLWLTLWNFVLSLWCHCVINGCWNIFFETTEFNLGTNCTFMQVYSLPLRCHCKGPKVRKLCWYYLVQLLTKIKISCQCVTTIYQEVHFFTTVMPGVYLWHHCGIHNYHLPLCCQWAHIHISVRVAAI